MSEPAPSGNAPHVQRRLDSWKEIAAYLRRDVKTARRWELHEGMPVHRHRHGTLDSVYAFEHEIELWRRQRRTSPPVPPRARAAPVLVGRSDELAALHTSWHRARNGHRQMVFVAGELGIGKTALVQKFLADAQDGAVIEGQCLEQSGISEPYLPVIEALLVLTKHSKNRRIGAVVANEAPTWADKLLGRPRADMSMPGETAGERSALDLCGCIEAIGRVHPLLVAIEDLHWSDGATIDLLARIARRHDAAPLMIVATFRPASFAASHPAAWRVVQEILAHFHATRIELSRFNEHDVGEYLRMQGRWHDVDSAVPWFYERTLGNPSFLVHLFRHAAASGALRHENGDWVFDPDEKSIAVPLTLRQLIQSHIATLDEPSTRLLETASIVGYEFAAAAVAAASEEHVHSVEERLRDLSHQGELISRAGDVRWPDGTASTAYRFQHAYQRQVLYDNVPAGIRTALHLRIARRLENAFGDQGEEIAAALAMHFECGRDYRAAVEQYIRAHDNAIFRGAQHEALGCAESAIRALRQLPDTQARDIDELGLRLRVWAALMNVNTMVDPTAEAAMDKAVTLAEKIDGAPLSNITLMWASRVRLMAGETRAVWTLTEQLLARARASNVGMATAINQQAMILLFEGETERAASLASEALQIADEHGLAPAGLDVQQLNLKTLAWACWIGGDIPRLQSTIEAFLRRAEALNEPIAKAFAYGRCAPLLEYLGCIDRSVSLLKSAAHLVEKHRMTQVKRWTDAVEGWLLSRHGAAAAGVARLSDAIDILNQQGMKIWTPWFYAWLSEALLLNGEPSKSLRAADDGLERSAEMSVPGYDPELLRLRGEALLRLSRTNEAEVAMRYAHALATSHRSKTFELRAALSLARMAANGLNTGDVVGLLSHALQGFAPDVWTPDLEAARAMLANS